VPIVCQRAPPCAAMAERFLDSAQAGLASERIALAPLPRAGVTGALLECQLQGGSVVGFGSIFRNSA
jgi:hypothetical protein